MLMSTLTKYSRKTLLAIKPLAIGVLFLSLSLVKALAQQPPPGAVVLFSGKKTDIATNWYKRGTKTNAAWTFVSSQNAMRTTSYDIVSKKVFQDCILHVEFLIPSNASQRGNSGVFLKEGHEIQILDSYGISSPSKTECGAVYGQTSPLYNACFKPDSWQTYEIVFRAPRYDDAGNKIENAHMTVTQNGVLIQNNQNIPTRTDGETENNSTLSGPIRLQYHGSSVLFRNVWVLPLPAHGA